MSEPTITKALPVAQGGIEAKMGEKNTEMKNANPVVIAVRPVLPPSVREMISRGNKVTYKGRRHTTDTGCTLHKCGDGTSTHKCTHTDTEGINAVGDS